MGLFTLINKATKLATCIGFGVIVYLGYQFGKHSEALGMDNATKSLEEAVIGNSDEGTLIKNSFDTISFNTETNCANWVAWKITVDKLNQHKCKRKDYPFTPDDTDLLSESNKVNTSDYTDSGYDRGHLQPAADCEFSKVAMRNCMEMDNIIPQTKELNRGVWEKLESRCRMWAEKYSVVYVVAGPIYRGGSHKTIGNSHSIVVPEQCFKVVMTKKKGQSKAIGFIFDNSTTPDENLRHAVCTVDYIEKVTGYDFFSWLPDDLEDKIEAEAKLSDW